MGDTGSLDYTTYYADSGGSKPGMQGEGATFGSLAILRRSKPSQPNPNQHVRKLSDAISSQQARRCWPICTPCLPTRALALRVGLPYLSTAEVRPRQQTTTRGLQARRAIEKRERDWGLLPSVSRAPGSVECSVKKLSGNAIPFSSLFGYLFCG